MNEKELDEMIDWCRKKLADKKKKPVGFRLTSKSMDGYEKAIKAVRYIDADKAKEVFHHKTGGSSFDSFIDDVPTADVVEVKHGEWIGKPIAGYSTIRCSVCRDVFASQTGKWKHCPNCGAKMDEGNNNG